MVRIIIILLLFAITATAQDYTVNPARDSLVLYCRNKINATSAGLLTDVKARFELNRALGTLCSEYPALEKVDTVVLTGTTTSASLNTDFIRARMVLIKHKAQGVWMPLDYLPVDSLKIKYPTQELNSKDPEVYYTNGRRIFTHPMSQAISSKPDTIIVFYNAQDAKLASATDSVGFSPDYMDEFINLVCAYFAETREDYQKAQYYMSLYNSGSPKPREVDLKK